MHAYIHTAVRLVIATLLAYPEFYAGFLKVKILIPQLSFHSAHGLDA